VTVQTWQRPNDREWTDIEVMIERVRLANLAAIRADPANARRAVFDGVPVAAADDDPTADHARRSGKRRRSRRHGASARGGRAV
jgi:hypothetical protein